MDQSEIQRKIASFPRWHYEFDLAGNQTPIYRKKWVARHRERKRYFLQPTVDLLGGSLKGKRVLDLGCNAGYWSLAAAEAGADFVLGVDGRQMHVDQANFVFEVKGIDKGRYQFAEGNVYDFDYAKYGEFDIVFCFGLLYHIAKPVSLIELISEVNTDVLVLDTGIVRGPGSFLRYRQEKMDDPRAAMEYELVSSPTKGAVRDIVRNFGYQVVCLKPQFGDYNGSLRYKNGYRRAFLGAKKTDLGRLKVPIEPWEAPTHWSQAPVWFGYRMFEAARRAGIPGFRGPGT
jgi:SAM-dependent methyltransferase